MGIVNFKIPSLEDVFADNVLTRRFTAPEKGQYDDNSPNGYQGQAQPESDSYEISYLGTRVYSWLQLGEADRTQNSYRNDAGAIVNYDSLRLNEVLITVSQQKNIVKTQVAGRSGTVKEYIADGDYAIQVQGFLVNANPNIRPKDRIETLLQICKAKASVKAYSNFLNLFGISDLVIESYNFPQKAGFWNVQPFELTCVSDVPFELIKE